MENNRDLNLKIQKAITEVVAFFDFFDYPPTAFEIWQYLSIKCELGEVINILDLTPALSLVSRGDDKEREKNDIRIIRKGAFYFLTGREGVVNTRNRRYSYTDRKIKRAIFVSRIFKFVPWIKMIAIGNIIGAHNLKKEGDIDFFIITESKRLWITRIFCVVIIKLLRLRPVPGKEKDKICLSFFASEKGMDLYNLMLGDKETAEQERTGQCPARTDGEAKDIYFIYWLAGLVPICSKDNIYDEFINKNKWIFEYLPNWERGRMSYKRNTGAGYSIFYRDVVDMFFGGLDSRVKKLQIKILPDVLKRIMNKDTRVVISDDIAKLHSTDKREKYLNNYRFLIKDLRLNNVKKKSIDDIIKEYADKLPRFLDGRIDYSASGIAPVINCFVRFNGKILLLKRSDKVLAYKNMWNSIGGFLDEPKSIKEKIKEEIREELGIEMDNIERIIVGDYYEYDDKDIGRKWIINPAIVDLKKQVDIKLDWEHIEYRWIDPKDINNFDIVPDTDICLERVMRL